MIKTIVVAHDLNRLIGYNNTIPWHYKDQYPEVQPAVKKDLKFFRKLTTGHPVIMGRTTFKTLPRPLKNRTNIVLSTKANFDVVEEDRKVVTCSNWDKAFEVAQEETLDDEIFIIGGANVYKQALEFVDVIYRTIFNFAFEPGYGNKVYFPSFSSLRPPHPKEETPLWGIETVESDEHFKIEKIQKSSGS